MIDCELRTNSDFRNRRIKKHHREFSIIEELPIDIVNDFVTSDSLHLLHLGVMKKCLLLWIEPKRKFEYRWTENDVNVMNTLLEKCNSEMPTEINRSIRSLSCIKFWKGTEFRVFLMYIGIVVLKKLFERRNMNIF